MSDYLKSLVDRRQETWHRVKEILNAAQSEGRDLTPEERENIDAADIALSTMKEDEARLLRMEAAARVVEGYREDKAVIEKAIASGPQTDSERFGAMLRGELRAFESSVRPEFRALQSAGGSAIPTNFSEAVTVYLRTLNPIWQVATVLDTPTGAPIVLPRLTADPAHGGTITAEAGGINELDPTISNVQLDSYKYAVVTLWSAELGQDNVIGLDDLIARSTARELAIDIGAHMTTGTGSSQPNGFITAGTNGGTANGTAAGSSFDTFFAPADLVDLYYSLAAGYRSVGSWQLSTTAAAKARKFRDSNAQFVWQPSLIAGQPDNFLGRPVYENPAMAAVASASKSVAFGDFSRYFIRRLPTRIEVSSDYKFSADQLAIKVVERQDGDLVDAAAVAFLVSANT